jgi:single-strand DNA-binding protein
MGQDINSVTIVGRLTRDPEMKSTSGGNLSICELGVAVNGRRKDAQGEWQDDANFFDVTVFGNQADNCERYLAKGRPVAISGRLDWQSWEDKNGGGKRSKVVIIANTVQFLGSKPDDAGSGQAAAEGFSDAPADTADLGDSRPATADDDIPF